MNSFQTQLEPTPKEKKPKQLTSQELDELCGTMTGPIPCNDLRRNHLKDGACGVYPCLCTKFTHSGKYHDWSKTNEGL